MFVGASQAQALSTYVFADVQLTIDAYPLFDFEREDAVGCYGEAYSWLIGGRAV